MACILALADWYLPSYKAGGLVTALSNVINLLGEEFDFYVFTRGRDLGEPRPYAEIPLDQWVSCGKARVLYTSNLSFGNLRRRILEVAPDLLYLNSFFSALTVKTLCLLRLGLLPPIPILLAPRGEFASAALAIKPARKRLYLLAARALGLCTRMVWQATSPAEREQIETVAGVNSVVQTVGDVPALWSFGIPSASVSRVKAPGAARFLFLSRIARNKNLDFALRVLSSARGQVEFEVCGLAGDAGYWKECRSLLGALPSNVSVNYRGAVPREYVPAILGVSHFLLLPTGGENFGYAIVESLAAGCPVIISDQTPWQDLEKSGVGWDLPLGRPELWRNALQECIDMGDDAYRSMSNRSRCFAQQWLSSPFFHRDTVSMFRTALDQTQGQRLDVDS